MLRSVWSDDDIIELMCSPAVAGIPIEGIGREDPLGKWGYL